MNKRQRKKAFTKTHRGRRLTWRERTFTARAFVRMIRGATTAAIALHGMDRVMRIQATQFPSLIEKRAAVAEATIETSMAIMRSLARSNRVLAVALA